MKRLFASSLALCLVATTGLASAQTYRAAPSYQGQGAGVRYDYARVIRVDPVFDSRYGSNYPASNSQRCYERQTYVRGDGYNDGYYRDDGYNGSYRGDSYGRDSYGRNDGYYDQYGNYRRNTGSQAGATVATVVGGIVGAAIGSQVGGGSARYATSAIGSMVGGMAGRQIYEQNQRQRQSGRVGTVTVCDPVPAGGNGYYSSDRSVETYDVTYEYAGQQYTTRTNYHPGDRIRVRVDVRPE